MEGRSLLTLCRLHRCRSPTFGFCSSLPRSPPPPPSSLRPFRRPLIWGSRGGTTWGGQSSAPVTENKICDCACTCNFECEKLFCIAIRLDLLYKINFQFLFCSICGRAATDVFSLPLASDQPLSPASPPPPFASPHPKAHSGNPSSTSFRWQQNMGGGRDCPR